MSLTTIAWLLLFLYFSVRAFTRPIWGACLYLMTFYALPIGWWWGKGVLTSITTRWNLLATMVFLVALFTCSDLHKYRFDKRARLVFQLLLCYAVNATLVHFFLAEDTTRSYNGIILLWKQLGLGLLLYWALLSRDDLKKFMYAILAGALYVSYEIVINGRGGFEKGRLEGIFIPGAAEANYMAGLLALSIPLAGALFLTGKRGEKIFALAACPLIFDVILRCNSRGAYLALLGGGARMYFASTGRMRTYANYAVILVFLAVLFQAKDPKIAERFWSIFAAPEQRDAAAQSRIDFAIAGLKMLRDYPFGSGAEAAFKSNRGSQYIRGFYGGPRSRAAHNGYIDIATSWGIQGFVLYAAAIWIAWRGLRQAIRHTHNQGHAETSFFGVAIESALFTQLIACGFISSLDGEWFYWITMMMLAYGRLYGPEHAETELDTERITAQRVPASVVT